MQDIRFNNITTDQLSLPPFAAKKIEVAVLRLDKIHPFISGNKWFKLRYYLEEAKRLKKKKIITFGGPWSNHIIATAAACRLHDFAATGMIRGEEPGELSPILMQAKEMGMQLVFLSREEYSRDKKTGPANDDGSYFIPEGGYGVKGAEGAATILDHCRKEEYTHLCCAAGTGTMTAGLVNGSLPSTRVIAISVLKNNFELEKDIRSLLDDPNKDLSIIHDHHFGGYAKYTPGLIDFMNEFYRQTAIPSDFVYTGKLFFAVNDLIRADHFPPGSKVQVIHSGGLSGNASLEKGTLIF